MIQLIESFIRENTPAFSYKQEKDFSMMTENEKGDAANRVIDQLYQKTAERYVKLNLSTVEASQGDITKVEFYDTIKSTIVLLDRLAETSNIKKSDVYEVDEIRTAFMTLHDYKNEFILAFKKKSDVARILYTTMVVALLDATTIMMDSWLVYVKQPEGNYTLAMAKEQVVANRRAKRGELAITNIMRFNSMTTKGELKKMFTSVLEKAFIGQALAVIGLSITLIVLIRELTYFIFFSRAKIADSLNYQKKLLELNASTVAFNSDIDKAKRKEIIKNQAELIKTLETLSNAVAVSERQAAAETREAIETEKRETSHMSHIAQVLI